VADPRKSRRYQELRAEFLATHEPICHWCGVRVYAAAPASHPLKATTDHLVEVETAPHLALDTSLWVVSCLGCNSSRGARFGNARRAGRSSPPPSRDW
jgi:hypothetical protein